MIQKEVLVGLMNVERTSGMLMRKSQEKSLKGGQQGYFVWAP